MGEQGNNSLSMERAISGIPAGRVLRGTLKEQDLADLVISLQSQKATGSLRLSNGPVTKSIYLKEGQIVFASSNQPEDRLGEVLLRLGKISPEQFFHTTELVSKTGKQHGAILVQEGYLKAHELFEGLRDQIHEIVCGLLLWDEGEFEFIEGDLSKNTIILRIDMVEIVSEALNRILYNNDLRGQLEVFHNADGGADGIDLEKTCTSDQRSINSFYDQKADQAVKWGWQGE